MKIYDSILDYIGNTPLIKLNKIKEMYELNNNIYAKCEMFNPSSSIKARIAKSMILNGIKKGLINKNTTIIEPTSGNTGIGLAMVCAILNLRFIAIMPNNVSLERKKLMKAYNGEIIITDKSLGIKGAVDKANELHKKIKNSYIPSQFENSSNPFTHYQNTGKEIYNDLKNVDIIISPIGSGGTISGIGKYLKEQNKDILIYGIEPFSSPLITKNFFGSHKIQGIGANFIPKTLDLNYVDKVYGIKDEEAYENARLLCAKEGILCGISSGSSLALALKIDKLFKEKNIVIILPDTGERYLSTDLFDVYEN